MKTSLFHRLAGPISRRLLGALAGAFLASGLAFGAPSPDSGSITGRVYNPATKEFVRNAEIRVEGTTILTASEDGGYYSLRGVPAGHVNLSVAYTGYLKTTQTVSVQVGQVVVQDFELTSSRAAASSGADVVKLGAFVVSSGAEGQAKQIMNQRNSMSLGTSVSSDLFGDVTEGNVGEF